MKRLAWLAIAVGLVWACPFDTTLREYLRRPFWMPFSKGPAAPEGITRLNEAFAGMGKQEGALGQLRRVYQGAEDGDPVKLVSAARADARLSAKEREEVELLDAKFAMRDEAADAKEKFRRVAATAQTAAYASEARGWLARLHYLAGEQSAAGKIYLDELKRSDTNLSEETIRNSLSLTYGYDGGQKLREQLADYFDTPEHAEFALAMVTNPRWDRTSEGAPPPVVPYARIQQLLEKHRTLLQTERVRVLGMRAALRAGDPAGALRLAGRGNGGPDYLWMLGSARFLTKDFSGAAGPLFRLWSSKEATDNQRAAAAYGLCGVYMKLDNRVEQLRFAMWLGDHPPPPYSSMESVEDGSVYWAASGFDLGMLLDVEASVDDLRAYLAKYGASPLVRYSLGVRLAREGKYSEAAEEFEGMRARLRAGRMRKLAELAADRSAAGRFAMAEYLDDNQERLLFNDRLWNLMQTYALQAKQEAGFTKAERVRQLTLERKLRDEQEERWQAYLLLRGVVKEEGRTALGNRAAERAIRCLRRLSERFGRADEIRDGDIALTRWLRGN